jgi:putative addiction module killer protein
LTNGSTSCGTRKLKPGYRVYYHDTGKEIIILLCGGDKTTQQADIGRAKKIAKMPLEEEE